MNYKDEIKAILFDYDGTLINFDYTVTDYTIKALNELSKTDYKICLASGRPCYVALNAFKDVFKDARVDYIFGCNGSEMMDVKADKTEILFPLKAEEVRDIASKLNTPYGVLGIYDGKQFLVNQEVDNPILIDWMNKRWLTPKIYDFLNNDKIRSKVLLISDPKNRKYIDELLNSVDLSAYNSFFSSAICYEIAPKGISKAKSCELLAKELNCDIKQLLAFGDMENDVDMLLAATGVAMGNASDEIKKLIPLHTDSVDKTGVYQFLKKNSLI